MTIKDYDDSHESRSVEGSINHRKATGAAQFYNSSSKNSPSPSSER
jgi:hypothetical protein